MQQIELLLAEPTTVMRSTGRRVGVWRRPLRTWRVQIQGMYLGRQPESQPILARRLGCLGIHRHGRLPPAPQRLEQPLAGDDLIDSRELAGGQGCDIQRINRGHGSAHRRLGIQPSDVGRRRKFSPSRAGLVAA